MHRTSDGHNDVVDFPLDLRPHVPEEVIDGFFPGALAACEVNGRLVCLRNDLAQGVLWYNARLMEEFGYEVPTTWEEYKALGLRVAKEHPGFVVGAFGNAQALNMYFWPSQFRLPRSSARTRPGPISRWPRAVGAVKQ